MERSRNDIFVLVEMCNAEQRGTSVVGTAQESSKLNRLSTLVNDDEEDADADNDNDNDKVEDDADRGDDTMAEVEVEVAVAVLLL
jgi:hypothetical protein